MGAYIFRTLYLHIFVDVAWFYLCISAIVDLGRDLQRPSCNDRCLQNLLGHHILKTTTGDYKPPSVFFYTLSFIALTPACTFSFIQQVFSPNIYCFLFGNNFKAFKNHIWECLVLLYFSLTLIIQCLFLNITNLLDEEIWWVYLGVGRIFEIVSPFFSTCHLLKVGR